MAFPSFKEIPMLRVVRLIPALAMLAVATLLPVSAGNAGTNPLPFLQLGAGARSAALSGAVTASVADANAAYWNPAALAIVGGWDLAGTHTEWLQDIRYEQVSLARTHHRSGFGLSFATAYAGDFDGRDEVGNKQLSFGFSDVALGASYAFAISPRIAVGGTVKYYRESIDDYVADGTAFDLGVRYQTDVDGLAFGATIRNLGGDVKFDVPDASSYNLPRVIQAGLAYRVPAAGLGGSLLVAADVVAEKNQDTSLRLGTEYRYRDQFGLLVGYRTDLSDQNAAVAESEKLDDTQHLSFGASFEKKLRFEYAFVPYTSDLGSTHRFSIGKRW
jgi:hypothetical protein